MSMNYIREIKHSASGATAKIHDYGATLMSYKSESGRECLFMSRDAKMDASKAIRGGVPLVFPQFGRPDTSMPQHGFLRVSFWTADESSLYDNPDSAGITYTLDLKDVTNARGGPWAVDTTEYDCKLAYHVKIDGRSFTTDLEIQNTGSVSFPFQSLQHTYYAVDDKSALDPTQCNVTGLAGYTVSDKISMTKYVHDEKNDPIIIDSEVDRVYSPPLSPSLSTEGVTVIVGVGGGNAMKVSATGTVDGEKAEVSCVVWNPHIEKAIGMSDFGNDQYHEMICVEPGLLSGKTLLPPGKKANLTVVSELQQSQSQSAL
mmetsp:Transcript_26707/g.63694  ORF Transcript_26707/g.63694 Transcript_26707/m.63694 type:complete len:316 (+) Transcript_26707:132-1079(+)